MKNFKKEPNIIDNWLEENGNQEIAKQVEIEAEELSKQEIIEEVAEKLKSKELFNESNDRARKILSEIKSLPTLDYTALLQPVGTKQETLEEYDIKDNKIMLLEEDLECVNMYLDDLKLPRTDDKGNEYSIVGRIKILQQEQDKKLYSELIDLLERLRPIYKEDSDLHQKYEEKRVEIIEQFKKK